VFASLSPRSKIHVVISLDVVPIFFSWRLVAIDASLGKHTIETVSQILVRIEPISIDKNVAVNTEPIFTQLWLGLHDHFANLVM